MFMSFDTESIRHDQKHEEMVRLGQADLIFLIESYKIHIKINLHGILFIMQYFHALMLLKFVNVLFKLCDIASRLLCARVTPFSQWNIDITWNSKAVLKRCLQH